MTAHARRPIRCAVVGAGWAGTRLTRAAQELGGDIAIVSLVDPDPDHLATVSRGLGIGLIHRDLDAALTDELDAVLVCSPHREHAPQVLAAIAAGKHVLVEKPMALGLDDADRMVAAAEASNLVLGVAENEVHEPWVDELRRVVETGEPIGELAFAVVTSGHRAPAAAYPGRRAWLTRPADGGTGSWMLHGIHTVAVARRVLGEMATVYAREHRTRTYGRPDLEATMSLLMTRDDGTPVSLVQTPEVDLGPDGRTIALYGDRGTLVATRAGWRAQPARLDPTDRLPAALAGTWATGGGLSSYALELAAFVRAIREGSEMVTSGRSERRSLAIVLAAAESVRMARAIDLDGRNGPAG